MKEKRYQIVKRGELEGRNPPGINALAETESSVNGDILEDRSRRGFGAPRSSLNNGILNERLNRRAPRAPTGNKKEK